MGDDGGSAVSRCQQTRAAHQEVHQDRCPVSVRAAPSSGQRSHCSTSCSPADTLLQLIFCSMSLQLQSSEEPQLFLCHHHGSEHCSHQPPHSHLGGEIFSLLLDSRRLSTDPNITLLAPAENSWEVQKTLLRAGGSDGE